MTLAAAILGALAVLLLVPSGLLLAQMVLAALPFSARRYDGTRRPALAVLVPAHDEARGIAQTLAGIQAQLRSGDRLLVVADNCSDDTASIAATAGAEVIERVDAARRGKGFALDFGVQHLARRPPEAVIVIDADCEVGEGALGILACAAGGGKRPVQALYLMRSSEGAGMRMRVAEFAWLVKNYVRPLGYHRLGLPCHLMGSGMAFPWATLERVSLADGGIVEDLMLGLELALTGAPARFCPQAVVTSRFPTDAGVAEQRRRWEHGHLAAILQRAPGLVYAALARRDGKLLALAIDLCVPPLALLAVALAVILGTNVSLYLASSIAWPALLATVAFGIFASAVLIAWWRFGREIISLSGLAGAAFYAIGKLPLYARFVNKRENKWVRSRREGE